MPSPVIRAVVVAASLATALCGCSNPEERRDAHVERADQLLERGAAREARVELQSALLLDPDDAELAFRIARLLDREHDPAALFYYEETRRLDPGHDEATLAAAKLLAFEDPEGARAMVDGVIEREPENARAHARRAELRLVDGDLAAAEAAAREALRLAPDDPVVQLQYGVVQQAALRTRALRGEPPDPGRQAEALRAFERAVELSAGGEPAEHVRAHIERARVLAAGAGSEAEAREAFEAAARAARPWPEQERRVLSAALEAAPAVGTGLRRWAFERAVERFPEDPGGWIGLARVTEEEGGDGVAVVERYLRERPEDARAHATWARELARAGDPAAALAALEEARARGLDAGPLLRTAIEILLGEGRVAEARTSLEALRELEPTDPETRLATARVELAEGSHDQAVRTLRNLIVRRPSAEAWRLLATAELRAGRPEAAQDALGQARGRVAPSRATDLDLLEARILAALGDWSGALEALRRYVPAAGAGADPAAALLGAQASYELGRPRRARAWLRPFLEGPAPASDAVLVFARYEPEAADVLLRAALEREPTHAGLLAASNRRDLAAGRAEEAVARAEGAAARAPGDPAVRRELAVTLEAAGQRARALEVARAAARLDPTSAPLLATLLARDGSLDEAVSALEVAAEAGHLDREGLAMLGRLESRRGDLAAAIGWYERALEVAPDPVLENDLAWALARRGRDLDRALDLASRARSALPDSPEVADTLGVVHLRRGEGPAAVRELTRAVALAEAGEGAGPSLHAHLGMALHRVGREEEARRALERALAPGTPFEEKEEALALLRALSPKP